ncbi:MAG: hypothetical protein V4438_01890, partial [Patescibacteria group bacterium]
MTRQNLLYISALFLALSAFSLFYINYQGKRSDLAAVAEASDDAHYAEIKGYAPPYITFSEGASYDANNGGAVFFSMKQKAGLIDFPIVVNGELLPKPIYLYPASGPAPLSGAIQISIPLRGADVSVWALPYEKAGMAPLASDDLVIAPYISPEEGSTYANSAGKFYISKSEALDIVWKIKSWDVGTSFDSDLSGSFKANGVASNPYITSEKLIGKGNKPSFKKDVDIKTVAIDCSAPDAGDTRASAD